MNTLTKEEIMKSGSVAVKNAGEAKKHLEVSGFNVDEGGTGEPPTLECIASLMFMALQDKGTKLMNYLCVFALIIKELTGQQIINRISDKVTECLEVVIANIDVSLRDQIDYIRDQVEQLETANKTVTEIIMNQPNLLQPDNDIDPELLTPPTIQEKKNPPVVRANQNTYANAARALPPKSANHQAAIERSAQRLIKIIIDVEREDIKNLMEEELVAKANTTLDIMEDTHAKPRPEPVAFSTA
jgi:hypothetical protein